MNQSRRQSLCSLNEVHTACRMTCGLCSVDDTTFTYTAENGFVRNRAWTGRRRSRMKRYCKRNKIRSNCPITHGSCEEKFNCVDKENSTLKYKKRKYSVNGSQKTSLVAWKYVATRRCATNVLQHVSCVARIVKPIYSKQTIRN